MTEPQVLVIILHGASKISDSNINNLKWTFSDPYFEVQVCIITPPVNPPANLDNYFMEVALTYAAEGPYHISDAGARIPQHWWNNLPCLIVRDSSISNVTPLGTARNNTQEPLIGGMEFRIQSALSRAQKADLYFLCTWNDLCNKYIDVEGVGNINHGSTLKWTFQPTSTQAVMYTPSSRDFVRLNLKTVETSLGEYLNKLIAQGQLSAVAFVPNIIDFDINLATSNSDYGKLNECVPVASTGTTQSNSDGSFIWFGIIVALIILTAWALIQIGPKYMVVTEKI